MAYRIAVADNGAPRVEWEKAAVVLSADGALTPAVPVAGSGAHDAHGDGVESSFPH